MTLPSRYGTGLGPYRPIPGQSLVLSLAACGVNVAKRPSDIEDGESPNASDVLFRKGGVSSDYGLSLLGTAYSGGANKNILHIAEFKRKDLTTVLVRMRPTEWDRWNGTNWTTLTMTPALSGLAGDRIYSIIMQDKLITALRNGTDKLKKWDGIDGNAVVDLSSDSPIAWFLAPMGQRIVAARIKSGGSIDPYLIQWSGDGFINDWTDPLKGAGSIVLEPEGKTGSSEFITGLSALETALVVYRQRSIVLGTRTGLGTQPFRWATVIFGLGTDSPYSIANGGAAVGDFFLGSDLNVYLFNGNGPPLPIGEPIYDILRTQITSPELASGVVDRRNGEYHLAICTGGSTIPNTDWVFDIRALLINRRLSWRKKNISSGYTVLGFSSRVGAANPVVDSISSIVDTVSVRVDEFGSEIAPQQLMLGDTNGGVWYSDETTFIAGNYETKVFGDTIQELLLDRVQFSYAARSTGQIVVSLSIDGGLNWSAEKVLDLPVSGWEREVGTWFGTVVNLFQLRIRILSGDVTISKVNIHVTPRGRAAA